MSYRSDRFNKRMLSANHAEEMIDASKNRYLSDAGLGLERLVDALDFDPAAELARHSAEVGARQANLVGAVLRLSLAGKAHLIGPLLLIFEHGDDLDASLKKMKRSTYFWARNQLLEFFIGL